VHYYRGYVLEYRFDVTICTNYKEAEKILNSNKSFDYSLLDVVLTNGKTGIHLAEKYEDKLGKILFITGCRDIQTLETLHNKQWCSVSKQFEIWDDLFDFLNSDKKMYISLEESC
jgi:hypothetical protein